MNRRHKVILFLTLVMTGTSLLAGATLSEGLGILILGAALAWLVGSETATRTYTFVKKVPGKLSPWVRVFLLMVLSGCLLVGVAIWSNYNPFLVVFVMSVFGMLFAPVFYLPTDRGWVRIIGGVMAIAVFFFAVVGAMTLSGEGGQQAEQVGALAFPGLIAIPIGTAWLAKGWRLLLKGISPEDVVSDPATPKTEIGKSTTGLYASLFIGIVILSFWLALLMFSAFTQSVFRLQTASGKSESPLTPVWALLFIILLGWWPFSTWKKILKQEPNSTPGNLRRHKRMAVALGTLFTIVLCVAITFGIQNGIDRRATATFLDGMKGFEETAKKIGAIKSREKQTTSDYSEAYAEIEPLEAEFDAKLQRFSNTLSEIRQRDRSRGSINLPMRVAQEVVHLEDLAIAMRQLANCPAQLPPGHAKPPRLLPALFLAWRSLVSVLVQPRVEPSYRTVPGLLFCGLLWTAVEQHLEPSTRATRWPDVLLSPVRLVVHRCVLSLQQDRLLA